LENNLKLDRPRIQVDFNELVDHDLVLMSKLDSKVDSHGKVIEFKQGQTVYVYECNHYSDENIEFIKADGIAELNNPEQNGSWTKAAKWRCRIDGRGIQNDTTTSVQEQE
jgi:hypothetical protein